MAIWLIKSVTITGRKLKRSPALRGQFKYNRFYLSTDLIENLKVHFLSFLEITGMFAKLVNSNSTE